MTKAMIMTGGLAIALCVNAAVPALAQKQAPPEGGPAKAFTVPAHETYTLPNGLKVTLVPYGNIPKVSADIMITAGSSDEAKDHQGVAGLTSDLLKEGTEKLTSSQLADEAARMGTTLGTSSSYDRTDVQLDVLSRIRIRRGAPARRCGDASAPASVGTGAAEERSVAADRGSKFAAADHRSHELQEDSLWRPSV